jgi:hypothetical protein
LLRGEAIQGRRITVELTPELHHGEIRNRYKGSREHGMFVNTPSRERQVFDELRIETDLEPGELLILGSSGDSPSSIGHAFHRTESSGKWETKLVVVRAAEVPPSQLFASSF